MRLRVAMRTTCPYEVVGWAQFAMPWPLEVKLRSSEFNFSSFTKDHRGKTKQKKRTYGLRPPPSGKNLGLNKAQGPPKGHKYQRPEWLLPPFDKQIARGCGRACQCQALIGCVFCIQVEWQIEPITIISASILQPARYGAVTYAVSWWMVDWAIARMAVLYHTLLVLLLGNLVSASNNTHGCKLNVPQDVQDQMEAKGNPLQVHITIKVSRLRDVPASGGSYGVDFM